MSRPAWDDVADLLAFKTCDWVCRWDTHGVYANGTTYRTTDRLTLDALAEHFSAAGPRVGLYVHHPVTRLGRFTTIDIDAHDGEKAENWPLAISVAGEAASWGVTPIVEHSNGHRGYKIWLVWDRWLDVPTLRAVGCYLMQNHPGHEIFPKQWEPTAFGNYVRLPGAHHKRPWWSEFYDTKVGKWFTGAVAPLWLADHEPQRAGLIPAEVIAYRDDVLAGVGRRKADRVERKRKESEWLALRRRYGRPAIERPGDRFNAEAEWADILEPHGWSYHSAQADREYWTRPGKTSGISACVFEDTRMYLHTSNAAPLEQDRTYTKFAAWAMLEFAGDYSAAARAVAKHDATGPAGEADPIASG